MPPTIRMDEVSVTKQARRVLTDVSVTFEPGGVYSILGPSGAGKTTLLRLLNRLDEPTAGTLWLGDTPYAQLAAVTLRRRVAMVFQVPIVFPGSVRDNLLTPARLQPQQRVDSSDCVGLLALAGLGGAVLERDAASLSVGEKQRVCLARALMTHPEVLLLDEPTAALDPTATQRLIESIGDLNRRLGLTVIIVSHQPEQARTIGGRIILLVDGRIAEHATATQFFAGPASQSGRDYLGRALAGAAS